MIQKNVYKTFVKFWYLFHKYINTQEYIKDRLSMVNRGRGVDRSSLVRSRSRSILGLSRVSNISNISTISISYLVVDSLDSAIRKSNRVGSRGGISIPALTMVEGSSRVIISNTIVEGIDWCLISIGRSSMTISWCWSISWCRFISWCRSISWCRCISVSGSIVSCCYSGQSKNNKDLKIFFMNLSETRILDIEHKD